MPEAYTDKELQCVDCQAAFTFTAGEQEHFAKLGFSNEPKRCKPCREAKKQRGGGDRQGGGDRGPARDRTGPREYHTAVCADCGKEARVPFKPRGDRPVYCSDCFGQHR